MLPASILNIGSMVSNAASSTSNYAKLYKSTQPKNSGQLVYPKQLNDIPMHKIMFNINTIDSKGFTSPVTRIVENALGGTYDYGNKPTMYDSGSSSATTLMPSMNGVFAEYTRISETIILQIPDNLQTQYGVDWKESDMGTATRLANVAASGMDAWKNTDADGSMFDPRVKSAVSASSSALLQLVQASLPQVATGLMSNLTGVDFKGMLERIQGKIVNPLVEVLFDSLTNRQFTLNFRFYPKNQAESEMVRDIIVSFKKNMHPEISSGVKSFIKYPNTFDITLLTPENQRNNFLWRFSTCALVQMSHNPISDGVKMNTHKNNSPIVQDISLTFKELEQMHQKRFLEKDSF